MRTLIFFDGEHLESLNLGNLNETQIFDRVEIIRKCHVPYKLVLKLSPNEADIIEDSFMLETLESVLKLAKTVLLFRNGTVSSSVRCLMRQSRKLADLSD